MINTNTFCLNVYLQTNTRGEQWLSGRVITKYADDSGVWSSDKSIKVAAKVVNQDLIT